MLKRFFKKKTTKKHVLIYVKTCNAYLFQFEFTIEYESTQIFTRCASKQRINKDRIHCSLALVEKKSIKFINVISKFGCLNPHVKIIKQYSKMSTPASEVYTFYNINSIF